MKIIHGLDKIKKYKNPVVALGVFDGVHRAHRRILKEASRTARSINGTAIAVTFWPHPQKEDSLYSLEHRLRLIGELGIRVCVVINFNKTFSRIPASDFVKNILVGKIGAHHVFVGKNFRYGRYAKGDYRLLGKLSRIYNFKLKIFGVIKVKGRSISSTYIRRLIREGDLDKARQLLCRPVSILGTVIKGCAIGRTLGFPTANINPHHEVLPPCGVYAVTVIYGNKKLRGLCYIGTHPTFKGKKIKINKKNPHVEAYILDFNKQIYGKYLEIQFIKKIRDEIKFLSALDLASQIKKDVRKSLENIALHS